LPPPDDDLDVYDVRAMMPVPVPGRTLLTIDGRMQLVADQLRHSRWERDHQHGATLDALADVDERVRELHADRDRHFDLLAGVHLTLGRIGDALGELARHRCEEREEAERHRPIDWPFATNGVFPTTGNLALNCGGPAQGREWVLQRLVCGGLTYTTPALGSAEVYSSGWIPSSTTPLSECQDHATQFPFVQRYVGRQVVIRSGEVLWVIVQNGTVGQTYTAQGTVLDSLVDP